MYIILAESFWDPSDVGEASGTGAPRAPYLSPDFNRLWDAAGRQRMVSPTFGGGTAKTEFEALCGMPTPIIFSGVVFYEVKQHLPCLPSILKEHGYRTFAFHSNSGGFYNRDVAYHMLGFDAFYDRENLPSDDKIGDIITDRSLISQAVATARKEAGGKPFLAYIMTMSGHWPFRWSDKVYTRMLGVGGGGDSRERGELARELNINYYTSRLLAFWARRIRREDPEAVVVIAGDHMPSVAPALAQPPAADGDWLTPRFFKTPLLVLDGRAAGRSRPFESAYELAGEILDRLGVAEAERHHLPLFERAGREAVRPLLNGVTLLVRPDAYDSCSPSSAKPVCRWVPGWLRAADIIATDVTLGHQYVLGRRRTPPAIAPR